MDVDFTMGARIKSIRRHRAVAEPRPASNYSTVNVMFEEEDGSSRQCGRTLAGSYRGGDASQVISSPALYSSLGPQHLMENKQRLHLRLASARIRK